MLGEKEKQITVRCLIIATKVGFLLTFQLEEAHQQPLCRHHHKYFQPFATLEGYCHQPHLR